MTPREIIRGAIPNASDELCEHVLWGRTPFPCGPVTAQDLYRAASRYRRAEERGRRLCEMCDRVAMPDQWCCECCDAALSRNREEPTA